VDVAMSTPDLELRIDASPRYRRGYPMLIAVTVGNPLPKRTYMALPEIDRFVVPPPVEFTIVAAGATDGDVLPCKGPGAHEGEPEGFRLGPGESWTGLVDLSELGPTPKAGGFVLHARYVARPVSAEAEPVSFEIDVPGDDEAAAVARLRASNLEDAPSWNTFLTNNFREVEPVELDGIPPEGRAALAFTLALHRAIYGAAGVDTLDLGCFRGLGDGAVALECEVLEHELAAARGDPSAATLRARVVGTWPGLAWRLAENDAREGLLTRLRQVHGAERTFPALPDPLPYGGP